MEENEEILEDEVDPRIKDELDVLNQSTDEINQLENKLGEHRSKFKASMENATRHLEKLAKKYSKSIDRARPYYATKQEVSKALFALQRATNNFQRANGVHRAAKETIDLAENRLQEVSDKKVDAAWQEMLNKQTIRFMEAERDRTRSKTLHEQAAKKYEFLLNKMNEMGKRHKKSTKKTKSYFEMKESFELDLQKQRHKVDELQRKINAAKKRYRNGLDNLERISGEIHEKRRQQDRKLLESTDQAFDSKIVNKLQLDIIGPKRYEDINDLEEELQNFDIGDYEDDGGFSSSDSESDIEDDDSETSRSSTENPSNGQKRHLRKQRKSKCGLSRSQSMEVTSSSFTGHRKILSVDQSVFEASEEVENEIDAVPEDTEGDESTYRRLHGTNISVEDKKQKGPITPELNDFDIFDELC